MRALPALVASLLLLSGVCLAGEQPTSLMDHYRTSSRAALRALSWESAPSVAGPRRVSYSASGPSVAESVSATFQQEEGSGSDGPLMPAEPSEGSDPNFTRRSPAKAFFLSLLLPGLGEMYSGYTVRGALFMAAEATAWSMWGIFRGKGEDWEQRYMDFKEEHWNFERFDAYRNAVWHQMCTETNMCNPDRPLSTRQQDSVTVLVGTHTYDDIAGTDMPSAHDQYEMVGKYFRFSYGWDDIRINVPSLDIDSTEYISSRFQTDPGEEWGTDPDEWLSVLNGALVTPDLDTNHVEYQVLNLDHTLSDNRDEYEEMRNESNTYKDRAGTMITVVLINHVISAIHAARVAKAANRNHGLVEAPDTQIRMTVRETDRDFIPMLMVRRHFRW